MYRSLRHLLFAAALAALSACAGRQDQARAPYVPLAQVEAIYGPLSAAGNHPTVDQHGTGERVGLFRDENGTIWGWPLLVKDGAILACAPVTPEVARVTDSLPPNSSLIGATNEPTGWRGGTGDLELIFRDTRGAVHTQVVHGAEVSGAPVCWAPNLPGPPQPLRYYRLAPAAVTTH